MIAQSPRAKFVELGKKLLQNINTRFDPIVPYLPEVLSLYLGTYFRELRISMFAYISWVLGNYEKYDYTVGFGRLMASCRYNHFH